MLTIFTTILLFTSFIYYVINSYNKDITYENLNNNNAIKFEKNREMMFINIWLNTNTSKSIIDKSKILD